MTPEQTIAPALSLREQYRDLLAKFQALPADRKAQVATHILNYFAILTSIPTMEREVRPIVEAMDSFIRLSTPNPSPQ